MNTKCGPLSLPNGLLAAAVASTLMLAWATVPLKPTGADEAVRAAEIGEAEQTPGAHRVYIVDRKVDIARVDVVASESDGTANLKRLVSILNTYPQLNGVD